MWTYLVINNEIASKYEIEVKKKNYVKILQKF